MKSGLNFYAENQEFLFLGKDFYAVLYLPKGISFPLR